MRLFLLILCSGLSLGIFGQNEFKSGISANLEVSFERSIQSQTVKDTLLTTQTNSFHLGPVVPAITRFWENGHYREWALSRLQFTWQDQSIGEDFSNPSQEVIGGNRLQELALEVRYERGHFWFFNRFSAGIGGGLGPYVEYLRILPKTSAEFNSTLTEAGLFLEVIPRLRYHCSDHWYFNLMVPARILSVGLTFEKVEDPSIPMAQQSRSSFDLNLFDQGMRLGLGVGAIF